ncbi:hypothetical protein [Niallia taxi]|uniref:hypothetical protein n=1 Tax=Niallia taxi TaxID=2499688 RepID=UPI0015F494CE|nr:hypothetical protein [Niallia taxi]
MFSKESLKKFEENAVKAVKVFFGLAALIGFVVCIIGFVQWNINLVLNGFIVMFGPTVSIVGITIAYLTAERLGKLSGRFFSFVTSSFKVKKPVQKPVRMPQGKQAHNQAQMTATPIRQDEMNQRGAQWAARTAQR